MKIGLQNTIQYKYIRYRFEKECRKNEDLEQLSQEDKESICMKAAQRTRSFTLIYLPVYIIAFLLFTLGFIMNPEYGDNAFANWYRGILESVFPLVNGDWGGSSHQKRGTFLLIFLKLIPILLINGLPLFAPIFIMANKFLKEQNSDIKRR